MAPARVEDEPMPDAQPQPAEGFHSNGTDAETEDDDDGSSDGAPKIAVLPGAVETAASFQFEGEDHTLGNSLRYIIMKNPQVEFCGYTIPHPSETKMNLRIQTNETTNVFEALQKGLDDLMDLCDATTEKFIESRDSFAASRAR